MNIFTLGEHPQREHEIAQLLHQQWRDQENWSCVAAVESRLRQRNLPGAPGFTLLACSDSGALTGTASVIEYELADDVTRRCWLGEVVTPEAWRGKGVGTALIEACIAHAGERQIDALWLYTPDQQSLYQRLGWREVEQREVGGERVSVMVRQLNV